MFATLTYRDGSANAYNVRSDSDGALFEYVPVRPEHSSTGTYSGGAPRCGRIDPIQVAELWYRVEVLSAATHLHVTDRGKGTGVFYIVDENGSSSFIIRRGPELGDFDLFVAMM
jgi:hypothetical protein